MNDTKTMGLRLPVQAAVDRTATGGTLADGTGVEASQLPSWLQPVLSTGLGLLGSLF